MRIDEFPTHEINGVHYRCGHALPYGASVVEGGVNFSISSSTATSCELVLFHSGEEKPFVKIPFPDDFKMGDTYSMIVKDLNIEDIEYGYCFDGPYDPEKGLLFDKERIILDPYAKLISGHEEWGKMDYDRNNFPFRGKVLLTDYAWEKDQPLETSIEDLIIYEIHVRGFSKDPSSKVNHPGTYAGIVEKIPYMKELGINCVELLPVFDFDEREYETLPGNTREYNFWGYSTLGFFAPKAGYAALGKDNMEADEFKNMVKRLHQNGIEIILDVVFNHTAEFEDTIISYREIDNAIYYLLDENGKNMNISGCGNTMNCNHAVVRNQILDCLRYWVSEYHIDGFRFDEAPILSRDTAGNPMSRPPLLEALALDPILSKTKLIAEAWDAGGLYQVGSFPAPGRWAEWNGKFRDCVRSFCKSDVVGRNELLERIEGSPDIYPERTARSCVNFVTCHDGFTLNDVFSYNEKHNLANGENNRDGIDNNLSWNCGAEGDTDDEWVNTLRQRVIKNAFAILMISRGTPMFVSGDEFRNTQFGNNNAYCQDNEISYLDWNRIKEYPDNYKFFKRMIALRNAHPVLKKPTVGNGNNATGYPEISFHGTTPWSFDWDVPALTFGVLYAEPRKEFGRRKDTFIYAAVNSYWEDQEFELPVLPEGFAFKVYESSDERIKSGTTLDADRHIRVGARTVTILIAEGTIK